MYRKVLTYRKDDNWECIQEVKGMSKARHLDQAVKAPFVGSNPTISTNSVR